MGMFKKNNGVCNKCGISFDKSPILNGKKRNLNRRKYCLNCSPFGTGSNNVERGTSNFKEDDYIETLYDYDKNFVLNEEDMLKVGEYYQMLDPFKQIKTKKGSILIKKESNNCFTCVSHYKNLRGYYTIGRRGKVLQLHRYIYQVYKIKDGEIPEGYLIRHACDNTSCVNPEHLLLGTPQDNMRDATNRGNFPVGSKNGTSKLKDDEVDEIIELLKEGTISQQKIADKYGVNQGLISMIKNNKMWKHKTSETKIIYNSLNKMKAQVKRSDVGFRGVSYVKNRGKYVVRVKIEGKLKQFGSYETALEAAKKADEELIRIYGEDVITNKKMGLY
jgi:hypothetical protein